MVESTLWSEFRQQARGAWTAGVVALVFGSGVLTGAIIGMTRALTGTSDPKLAVYGIIALCGGCAFFVRSFAIARRGRRTLRSALTALDPIAAAHTKPEDDEPDHTARGPTWARYFSGPSAFLSARSSSFSR
jgi:hypothetical protein